jgi:hypothetical protein
MGALVVAELRATGKSGYFMADGGKSRTLNSKIIYYGSL